MKSGHWKTITPSEFPWEREALEFVRERLPDGDPYRAWTNFEFMGQDGSINEVDLLVLSPVGFFLVEIKSWSGRVRGDAGTWEWTREGRTRIVDNPLLLTNRKAKKLRSLLEAQRSAVARITIPWIEPLVFLSAPDVQCELDYPIRESVFFRDRPPRGDKPGRRGIVAALHDLDPEARIDPRRTRIDRNVARALTRAMESAGIRPSQKYRRVKDYELGDLLAEGTTFQDWAATHTGFPDVRRRVRIYAVNQASDSSERATIERAARREFQILQGIDHPGILKAQDFTEHERGPALIFDHDPAARRLDHFLKEQGDALGIDQRLDLVRQLAEALRFAHDRKLFHRALSPQSILVVQRPSRPLALQIFNWQTASRVIESTTAGNAARTCTRHLDRLVDESVQLYLAPEILTAADTPGESFDVFGLGAVAFTIFSGQPPAPDDFARLDHLRTHRGLDLGTVLDGAGQNLCDLIRDATHPEVTSRLGSVADFCLLLDTVEEELSRPEVDYAPDPTRAQRGDLLEGDFRVKNRLGTGSTAVAYLVEHDGQEHVLKLAREPALNDRIEDEAAVLEQLRHHLIVALRSTVRIQGHAGLLLAPAGEKTLAERIKQDAPFSLDLLRRFGEDLLCAVTWLEEKGVAHRDIKPENIGVAGAAEKEKLHLVLFDFSLSRIPADQIRVGTHLYLDPFLSLRKPRRWDLAAERYSVALVLHEMATGALPVYGDGQSDPAVLDCEVTLDPPLFDVALRESLPAFFAKALRRNPRKRFHTAEEMLGAWRRIFDALDRTEPDEQGPDPAALETALTTATRQTALSELGLSAQALSALEREGLGRIGELLRFPAHRLVSLRGVGQATREELLALIRRLDSRFPEPVAVETPDRTAAASLDYLADALLATGHGQGAETDRNALARLFGLTAISATEETGARAWPTQAEVARSIGVTAGRVSQALTRARERLGQNAALTALRHEIHDLLETAGAVMTTLEIETAVATSRGSIAETPVRARRAAAVVRAAIEVESLESEPRWIVRRTARRILVCREWVRGTHMGGQAVADWVAELGRRADRLADLDPLAAPGRAIDELETIAPPPGFPPLPPARLVRIAVEASKHAALSSRGEIYPDGMPAERALGLSRGALRGAAPRTEDQVKDRVRSRYPRAARLPDRPDLDRWLQNAGLEFTWDPTENHGQGAYKSPRGRGLLLSSSSTSLSRRPTATRLSAVTSPEAAEARAFEARLARSAEEGAFLVLTVHPRDAARAETELERLPVHRISVEASMIQALRAEAKAHEIDWSVVLEADVAPARSEDRVHLQRLAGLAVQRFERQVAGAAAEKTVLLTRPGLLARYKAVDCLERLRDRVGVRTAGNEPPVHGVWVLVAAEDQHTGPVLDHVAVPVITQGQWARIPRSWIQNCHRGHGPEPGPDASAPVAREENPS